MAKIMVIEDEELLRNLIKDYLIRDGYVVIEAKDGKEGLDQYYKNDDIPICIITCLVL